MDFVTDLSKVDRQSILTLYNQLNSRADGVAWTTEESDNLKKLLVWVTHVLIDEPQFNADIREHNLYVDPLDSSHQTNISDSFSHDYHPTWSPSGRDVVFTSNRAGEGILQIHVMDMFGINVHKITNAAYSLITPDWSPNGNKIVFAGYSMPNAAGNPYLFIMNTDGTDMIEFGIQGANPVFSPDGTRIAFERSIEGGRSIYTMFADGTSIKRIVGGMSSTYSSPSWSPDGKRLVCQQEDANTLKQIYTMNADGSNQIQLTSVGSNLEPDWSPNGKRIVFTSNRDGQYELYTMDTDGSNQIRLTNNEGEDRQPNYSPDGTLLLCSSTRDGRSQLYTLNADGSPVSPEYRHEYLMTSDSDYYAAWAYEFSSRYRTTAVQSPTIMNNVARGRQIWTYRESDPNIVDRSLLRHTLRDAREGETDVKDIVGKHAPKLFFSGDVGKLADSTVDSGGSIG